MPIDRNELVAALAKLSPEERSALMGGGATANTSPKFSPAIDAVPEDEIEEAIKLLAIATSAPTAEFPGAVAECRAKFPALIAAAETNSNYRRKPLGHSLQVAQLRLQARNARKGN
jgi:hypothetical protein